MNEGADHPPLDKNQPLEAEASETPAVRKLVVPEPVNPSAQPDSDRSSPSLVDRSPTEPEDAEVPDSEGEAVPVVRKLVVPNRADSSCEPDSDRSPSLVDRDLSMVPEEESTEQMADSTAEPPVVRKLFVPEKP